MKRILAVLVVIMMIASNVHAISWTKTWSASDDGSPFSGSDIGDIQNDVSTQTPTLTGNNTLSGTNTFSGTTSFSGTVTGITGSAAHSITRGFELVWASTTTVSVNPGTLFHNTTQVNKTTATTLDITVAGDAIDGATAQQATSVVRYVYCDASGNLKLWSAAPDKADTAGNTDGTKIYLYYVPTTTYYRCLGQISLNATGAGQIEKFYQNDNEIIFDDAYANTYLRVLNAGANAGFTNVVCTTVISATIATDVSLILQGAAASNITYFRRDGSSATNGTLASCSPASNIDYVQVEGIPVSAGIFEYKVNAGNASMWVKSYRTNIR